jgi:hypothetical protein
LNPETYLRDVLAKIADGHPINRIEKLLPCTPRMRDTSQVPSRL